MFEQLFQTASAEQSPFFKHRHPSMSSPLRLIGCSIVAGGTQSARLCIMQLL
jgi:hypothetical protein